MAPPQTMRAARITKFGETKYKIQELEVPRPKGYELLIKTGAAGFCHTDAMVANGEFENMGCKCPITSREATNPSVRYQRTNFTYDLLLAEAGPSMGEGAENDGRFQIGDRVGALAMKGPCGQCSDCKVRGKITYCTNLEGMTGVTVNGGFAVYTIIESRSAAKIPEQMSFAQAAPLMCAGVTILTAIRKAEEHGLPKGGVIGFSGLGALGHLGVQFARVLGYTVVGIDARLEPIELAKTLKYPPHLTISSNEADAEQALKQIKDLTPDKAFEGIDAMLLLADPQESFDYSTKILARHGLLVLISQPQQGIKLNFEDLIFRDIRLVGSLLGDQKDLQDTLDLCAKHGIESTLAEYKFDQINEMVEANNSKNKKGKTVIVFE